MILNKKVGKDSSPSHGGKRNQEKEFSSGQFRSCFWCCRKHNPSTCPAKAWQCFKCKSIGHTSKVCRRQDVNIPEEGNAHSDKW